MKYDDFKVGYQGKYTRTITEELNKRFADVIGDYNPVHFDEARMKKSVFGKRATNGFLTESTIAVALVEMFTSNESIIIALKKEVTLLAPVFMGDTVTAIVTVSERIPEKKRLWCDVKIVNQDKKAVLAAKYLVKILEI
ncbi:hypothetical protein J4453_00270 [Candidatus Woesearchaeota archaeon]|nr:hypothetical protein [Candidatus Woesearchaeota archaeon]